ncbi:MAG TPA: BCAM0308 family protein [Pyrinomonadaceae bacterium]|nr:BCAM0308 family protein [Pyrinomonadaceae bacterium]
MRSNKRSSSTTFTKRVDHDGGRHRPQHALKEPAVCSACGATYAKRRWSKGNGNGQNAAVKHFSRPHIVICPACKQKKTSVPRGFVTIQGTFFVSHREEFERLLRNEAARAAEDNPLAQIMDWDLSKADTLTITTTTEHLAQRLGHVLEKAFAGKTNYDFSHENKLARVNWSRG